ncbi:hypothetical protein F4824DRAFT_503385 [Ustulina deusta]|nr:hypothetical protein F4824DRAFT_503385 [Ustulina deusta]
MKLSKVISSLSLPVFVSCAYVFPSELQAPLIQPPLPQTPDLRRIILQTTSKSISGSYPLYDLLSIATESRSISVAVAPHSASEDPSRPASLELKSSSGSVHVTFPGTFVEPSGIPVREYITSVSTQSTSISGTFPLGSHTSLDSRSGSLSAELVVAPINTAGPRRKHYRYRKRSRDYGSLFSTAKKVFRSSHITMEPGIASRSNFKRTLATINLFSAHAIFRPRQAGS